MKKIITILILCFLFLPTIHSGIIGSWESFKQGPVAFSGASNIIQGFVYFDEGFSFANSVVQCTFDGALPLNTDGGLKCFGHPIGASGLRMMYEVYKQLQGKGGPRQIKNPTLGLTHNLGGTPGSATVSVLIVGN